MVFWFCCMRLTQLLTIRNLILGDESLPSSEIFRAGTSQSQQKPWSHPTAFENMDW